MKTCLAIDIGGSKILVGIVDKKGNVVAYSKKDYLAAYTLNAAYQDILCMAQPYLEKYKPSVCGVSLPGPVNRQAGVCLFAPFLGIRDWHAAVELEERLGIPVFVENDVNACAIAERSFGKAGDIDDFMWITLSNGVGGAFYLNGSLYSGTNSCAGEFGHLRVEENGNLCSCGKSGCLETVASGPAISDFYERKTGLKRTAREISQLASEGDETASAAYKRAAKGLGSAIAQASTLLDVDVCYFGGGVAQSLDLLQDDMLAEIQDRLFQPANKTVQIEYTGLGYYASLCGAAAVAFINDQSTTERAVGKYLSDTAECIAQIHTAAVAEIAEVIWKTMRSGGTVFTIGNGGSAATASHMTNDLIKGCRVADSPGIRAVCLAADSAVMTCLANDFSYEDIFKLQLETLSKEGDLLCLFSGSGNSENIVRAAEFANSAGIPVVGFLGKDGGNVLRYCNYRVLAETDCMEKIEDTHLAIEHALVIALRGLIAGKKGGGYE